MKKNGVDYSVVHVRVPVALKKKVDKKLTRTGGCTMSFLVRRMLEEWVNGDLIKQAACDTFVLNK